MMERMREVSSVLTRSGRQSAPIRVVVRFEVSWLTVSAVFVNKVIGLTKPAEIYRLDSLAIARSMTF
jgi:hypothetical protein